MKTKFEIAVAFSMLLICLCHPGSVRATNYTLTLTTNGSGAINRNPSFPSYPSGVTVTITAVPNAGWYFDSWSGDTNSTLNPLNVVMNSNMNVTGNFVAYPIYTLALATNGQGGIVLSPSGGSYYSNTMVTATATPASGWVFAAWIGATNSTANPVSLALNNNGTLTGIFAQLPVIDMQPVSVTNKAGSTVSFTTHAVGTGPVNYQWYFSGGALSTPGNTATLGLTNINTGQAGTYWAVATNLFGSATSQVVSLVLTNSSGPTNLVSVPNEPALLAAIAQGGWIGLQVNGTLLVTNTITITNNVVLDGSGFAPVLSGGNAVQLFNVASSASLTISNVTLANGLCLLTNAPSGTPAQGGAIYNNGGNVTLVLCTLTNNSAQSLISNGVACGGAVFNNGGAVSIYNSVITSNSVVGGSLNVPSQFSASSCAGLGGALYNTNGTVAISGCTVSGNISHSVVEASFLVGSGTSIGGAVYQALGTINIAGTTFAGNGAIGGAGGPEGFPVYNPGSSAYGGAVAVISGNLTISSCQFLANQAIGGPSPGGMYGGGNAPAGGGAIYSTAWCSVSDSTLSGNQAAAGVNAPGYTVGPSGSGGAIYSAGTFTLNRCSVYGNNAKGGNVASDLNTTVYGGPGLGGGIYNAGQFAATNNTIALNSAAGTLSVDYSAHAAVSGNALGGGVYNTASAAFVGMNLTVASNTCISPSNVSGPPGGGPDSPSGLAAGSQIANTNGTLSVHNTLIAYSGTNSNAYGPITDAGYNICSDGSAALFSGSSYNYTDPQLAPLGNYGGPTLCMNLLPTSPAIDNGDINGCPNTDQRGYLRPFGSGPDMGAVDFGSAASSVPLMNMSLTSSNVTLSFSAFTTGKSYYLQSSTNLTTWLNLSTNGPFASPTFVSQTINKPYPGRCFFRLLVQ